MYQQTDSDKLQGSIRIPIETETEFQRAFNASFDRLPFDSLYSLDYQRVLLHSPPQKTSVILMDANIGSIVIETSSPFSKPAPTSSM